MRSVFKNLWSAFLPSTSDDTVRSFQAMYNSSAIAVEFYQSKIFTIIKNFLWFYSYFGERIANYKSNSACLIWFKYQIIIFDFFFELYKAFGKLPSVSLIQDCISENWGNARTCVQGVPFTGRTGLLKLCIFRMHY